MSRLSGINNTAQVFELNNLTELYKGADRAKEPLRKFLLQHAHIEDRNLFLSLARRMEQSERIRNGADTAPEAPPATATAPPVPENEEFRIVVPAFITSELKASFQAGFLILLPFLVIDLVVANIIVATGLSMVQPAVISLPVKILLFVLADGWTLIVKGLVLSYA
jgi:type III secretion protein R